MKKVMIKIKVIYEAPLDMELDKEIISLIEDIGGEWYAQGTNIERNERDICFDLPVFTKGSSIKSNYPYLPEADEIIN